MASNFDFLAKYWPDMAQLGRTAELYLYADANACMFKLGMLAERIAREICGFESLALPEVTTHAQRLQRLREADLLPTRIDALFHSIGHSRDSAVHAGLDAQGRAASVLRLTFHLSCWFMEVYGDWKFHAPRFRMPEPEAQGPDLTERIRIQEEKIRALTDAVEQIRTDASGHSRDDRAEKADQAARELPPIPEENELPAEPSLTIQAEVLPAISFAMQQNGTAAVRSVTIENTSALPIENAVLQVTASPAFALPLQRSIDLLPAGKRVTLSDPELLLDGGYLASTTEKIAGSLTFRLLKGDTELACAHVPITILAFDEWHGIGLYPELLSAFVTPNHPDLVPVITRAADHLGQWTGDPALDGYQSQDPNRVLHMAAALYTALLEQHIGYAVAPASFEQTGQRVRLCDAVLRQKLGTCLDLTLLYASALETVGLHPLLICTEGHIFAGLWLEERMFPECVQDDVSRIQKRLAAGVNEIAVVETTALTDGRELPFDRARSAGEQNLSAQPLECIIDIHRARMSGITPLPQRIHSPDGWIIRSDDSLKQQDAAAPRELEETIVLDQDLPDGSIPKKVQWEHKLLDLGMRNTLINLRLTRTQLPILTDSLDELENALSCGSDFSILPKPADWQSGEFSFESLHTMGTSGITRAEFENKRLRSVLTENELARRLKELYRTARTALEENGANTLYLALGVLRWYESKRSTRARYAPIVLLPIEIIRKSAAQGYVIRLRDEEPQMNITLLEKLKQDFGLVIRGLDPLPADDHGIDLRRVLTIMRKAVMEQSHWDVLETATLGIFSFSQFVMWNDIRSRTDDLMRNKVVRSLMEDRLCWEAEPLQIGDRVREDNVLLPMPADASQLHAIEAACAGQSFVLHGPPGTGKSQTITSLIANALAQGKRVLFVAEKMAALEVVQRRLDSIGIGPFCLELHSNKSRKKDVLEQLRQASEVTRTKSAAEHAARASQLAAMRAELDVYARQLHQPRTCGSSLYSLISTYENYKDAPDLIGFDRGYLRNLTKESLDRQALVVERLIAAAREVGHPHGHPLSRVGCTQYTQNLRTGLRSAAGQYISTLDRISTCVIPLAEALDMEVPTGMDDLYNLHSLAVHLSCWYDMPDAWSAAADPERYFGDICALADLSARAEDLSSQLLEHFTPGFLEQDGRRLYEQYTVSSAKWFLPKMLETGKLAKLLGSFAIGPLSRDQIPVHLQTLCAYQQEKAQADALLDRYRTDLDRLYQGADTDWTSITERASIAMESTRALSQHLHLRGNPSLRQAVTGLADGFADLVRAKDAFDALLCITPRSEPNWLEAQRSLCTSIPAHADELKEWIAYCAAAAEARNIGLGNVADQYAGGMDHDEIYAAYQKALLHGLICEAIDESDALNGFSGAVFNKKIEQYKRMDREWTALSQQEIYCRLASKVPDFTREAAHSSELGILQRAIKSGGRGTSIRRLFDQLPTMLPRLCPCMLMSPISAAQYLDPSREPFDIVVFDEASQLPTCKAVGVLARGTDAVIVGDPKQMPPTSFFSTNTLDEDNLEAEDLESILDDCLALNMPQSHLRWHYRSRHESLIAFSNSQFYENRLLTFPSVNDRVSKVTLTRVDGVFDRGKTRTNRAEALAVLEEIQRRYKDPALSKQSLGVVTFNISQQHLIDDLLSEACTRDPALEKWAYGSDEPLFIKNLENVQGDERDVILFSIGFGPDETGKVHMNFGPLNRDGGWRRLNVAVSRARCEMKVFSAMSADQLDLNRTKSEGVAALKKFLEYAEGRPQALEESQLRSRTEEAGIAASICDALAEHGYDTDRAVGRSEYRIDIGVAAPGEPDRYILGIMLDGPGYGAAKTTRDREIAQTAVLEGLGWQILRVWSMDWWDNPGKELARILKVLNRLNSQPASAPEHRLPDADPAVPEDIPLRATVHEESTSAYAPPVYQAASLPLRILSPEEFTDMRYVPEIRKRIEAVIAAEAPVSVPMLTRRVVQSFGISRSGSRIQGHMDSILKRMSPKMTMQENTMFCWRQDQDPADYAGYRFSGDGDSRRDVRDVPVQEVAGAVYSVLYEQLSMDREDLLRQTANKLGYTRLGANVVAAMENGIRFAADQGGITTGNSGAIALTDIGTARAVGAMQR